MLYVTCTMVSSVDLAHDRLSYAKEWVSVDCDTRIKVVNLFSSPVFRGMLRVQSLIVLLGCFGFGPLRQCFSLYQAISQGEGGRREK